MSEKPGFSRAFVSPVTQQGSAFSGPRRSVRLSKTPTVRGAIGPGLGLVDRDIAALHVGAIESLDRRIGLRVVVHFDEAEALRFAAELVADQVDARDVSKA
jgi:hypothetical protein